VRLRAGGFAPDHDLDADHDFAVDLDSDRAIAGGRDLADFVGYSRAADFFRHRRHPS